MVAYPAGTRIENKNVHHDDADAVFDTNGKGPVLTAPDGGQWRLVVDNDGELTTESVEIEIPVPAVQLGPWSS